MPSTRRASSSKGRFTSTAPRKIPQRSHGPENNSMKREKKVTPRGQTARAHTRGKKLTVPRDDAPCQSSDSDIQDSRRQGFILGNDRSDFGCVRRQGDSRQLMSAGGFGRCVGRDGGDTGGGQSKGRVERKSSRRQAGARRSAEGRGRRQPLTCPHASTRSFQAVQPSPN